jgi:hypothetical protein
MKETETALQLWREALKWLALADFFVTPHP